MRFYTKQHSFVELLRCHHNYVRRHTALTFGREIRTPAMQAGLAKKRLTFREIFLSIADLFVPSSMIIAELSSRRLSTRLAA